VTLNGILPENLTMLENDLKALIVESLNLEDINPKEISSEEALFDEGLGLDSIDALELGMAIQKRYGVRISSDEDDLPKHFATVRSLAMFVEDRQKTARP